MRLGPIRKHNRDGAHYLYLRVKLLILFNSYFYIPAVVFDLAEELIAAHHFGIAFSMMLQVNEIAIAKLIAPVGHFFGEDVSMSVNLQHGQGLIRQR